MMVSKRVDASIEQVRWDAVDILVANDFASRGWTSFIKTSDGEVVAIAENVRILEGFGLGHLTARFSYLTREHNLQLRLCKGEGTDDDIYFSGYVPELDESGATFEVVKSLAEQIFRLTIGGTSKESIRENPWQGCACDGYGFIESVDGKCRDCEVCKGLPKT